MSGENQGLDPTFADTIGEIGNIMMGAGATNLAGFLGRQVNITTPRVEIGPGTEMSDVAKAIEITISILSGVRGDSVFLLTDRGVESIVAVLTEGMDLGPDGAYGELGLSAVSEAMNPAHGWVSDRPGRHDRRGCRHQPADATGH